MRHNRSQVKYGFALLLQVSIRVIGERVCEARLRKNVSMTTHIVTLEKKNAA
jgi:hypothetical protein